MLASALMSAARGHVDQRLKRHVFSHCPNVLHFSHWTYLVRQLCHLTGHFWSTFIIIWIFSDEPKQERILLERSELLGYRNGEFSSGTNLLLSHWEFGAQNFQISILHLFPKPLKGVAQPQISEKIFPVCYYWYGTACNNWIGCVPPAEMHSFECWLSRKFSEAMSLYSQVAPQPPFWNPWIA